MLKPYHLFDVIKADYGLKNDAALAKQLGVKPPHISKVRNGALHCTDTMVLRLHERLGVPVTRIRRLLAEANARSAT